MPSLQESFAAFIAALVVLFQSTCDPALPPLVASRPANDAVNVARTTWIELDFTAAIPQGVVFRVSCDGGETFRKVTKHHLTPEKVVLNPQGELPAGANCSVGWRTAGGPTGVAFATAAAGAAVRVMQDRNDPARLSPIPDDYFLTSGPTTVTGNRLNVPLPTGRPNGVRNMLRALLAEANTLDGWSPVAHMVVEVSSPLDPTTLPRTTQESLHPLSSIALLDLDPDSATYGERIPFRIDVRNNDVTPPPQNAVGHTLLLWPAIPLEPEGRYGLVVTRRVLAAPGRPLDPSAFFAAALAPAAPGETAAVARTRTLAQEVLAVAGTELAVPIPADDVAYAARISIRSTDSIQRDIQVMKRQILAAPPPTFTIDLANPQSVVNDPDPNVAAYVRGTWNAPDWRNGGTILERDANGDPVLTGTKPVCFRLALPAAALNGPVPIVMYQHGNPGESETEVRNNAVNFMAQGGYAVVGFTDVLNREVMPGANPPGVNCINFENPTEDDVARVTGQVYSIVAGLLIEQRIEDHWTMTLAEQLAFVRAIQALDTLDLLPLGAPDGVPDIDTSNILYNGISEGGNNGQAFVPYSPEVKAAAVWVGGARLMEVLIHQQAQQFMTTLPSLFVGIRPDEIWSAISLFQSDFDRQDKHNHGRFAFREPAEIPLFCTDVASCLDTDWCDDPTHCTFEKASTLFAEGLNDKLVPNATTESAAWQYGIPHLAPVQRAVPFLDVVTGPIVGNIDAETTAAFYQYVPVGVEGITATPGCTVLDTRRATEGHYCAQSAVESRAQRLIFFGTAVDPTRDAPTIVDPLPYYPLGTPLFPLPSPLP
jgi:hypothetical protein